MVHYPCQRAPLKFSQLQRYAARERERERLRLVFGICGFVVQEFLAHPKPGVHTKVERDEVDVKKRSQKILLVEKSRMVRLTEEPEFPGMESATS